MRTLLTLGSALLTLSCATPQKQVPSDPAVPGSHPAAVLPSARDNLSVSAEPAAASAPASAPTSAPAPASGPRLAVFISDLHLGLGRTSDGHWSLLEDFRWPKALKAFLDRIGSLSGQRTDLIVAGDLLEMWQHPDVACATGDPEHGCTEDEVGMIADAIVAAHRPDLAALGAFASAGENRLYVIPGNHDAGLLIPTVWGRVSHAMAAAPTGRVNLVASGIWESSDRRIVAEHGHQIGKDVNQYKEWPTVTGPHGGKSYLLRPWGELFVQRLYNDRETDHPIIDNLMPQTNGARYYMAEKGFWGSLADVGRFLKFNLLDASFRQLGSLGGDAPQDAKKWDVAAARLRGYRLYTNALSPGDVFRKSLESPPSQEWTDLRAVLDAQAGSAADLSEDEVLSLCDATALRIASETGTDITERCPTTALGGSILGSLQPLQRTLATHLRSRRMQHPNVTIFVYGHTHLLAPQLRVSLDASSSVDVYNTGAFQRLIDNRDFLKRAAAASMKPYEALRRIAPEDLPACYSAVFIESHNGHLQPQLRYWVMDETTSDGELTDFTDSRCPQLAKTSN